MVILGLGDWEQTSNLCLQNGNKHGTNLHGQPHTSGLGAYMPTQRQEENSWGRLPGKAACQLGVYRTESMVDSQHHTQSYFQAAQFIAWQI